ncbi:MAG TPA: hypothetical protein EYP57_04425 [Thermodesulfobacteriaceae bacterium]|nr:hypothetical protein [Thermodesulfobacteriaceae bacterium]
MQLEKERKAGCAVLTIFSSTKKKPFAGLEWQSIRKQWSRCFPSREILAVILVLFILELFIGYLGPPHWNWIKITLLTVSLVAVFIVSTVPNHFIEEHL